MSRTESLVRFLPTLARAPRLGPVTIFRLWQQRRALLDLTPEQLADIGVTADEARAEAARPIWDVPSSWLR